MTIVPEPPELEPAEPADDEHAAAASVVAHMAPASIALSMLRIAFPS
jgi:hypothetical protein